VLVEAELPGVKDEDLEISVTGNELLLKGRRPDIEEKNVAFHRRERSAGDFERVLRLPAEIDAQKVEASLADGVLLLTLPKAEAAKPKKITVKTQ
jgi:HSP20 family protein